MARVLDERLCTAWHEAGHALVGYVSFGNPGVVTIRPNGQELGSARTERMVWTPATIRSVLSDCDAATRAFVHARVHAGVRHCLAGRAAERLLGNRIPPYSGDADSLKAVAYIEAGYPEDPARREGSKLTLSLTQNLIFGAESRRVRRYLGQHRVQVETIAHLLLERETIDGDDWLRAVAHLPSIQPPLYAAERRYVTLSRRTRRTASARPCDGSARAP